MKRIILTALACVLGAAILIGGSVFAAFMHDANTVSFDKWVKKYSITAHQEGVDDEEYYTERIAYPEFEGAKLYSPHYLTLYYGEVDHCCREYAGKIRVQYKNKADLDFTVENTGKLLTIKFTGTGYPEGGEPEDLSRTFIFDIEGVGGDKLPKLVNRAEFIGY